MPGRSDLGRDVLVTHKVGEVGYLVTHFFAIFFGNPLFGNPLLLWSPAFSDLIFLVPHFGSPVLKVGDQNFDWFFEFQNTFMSRFCLGNSSQHHL